jgi:hypothetical protein
VRISALITLRNKADLIRAVANAPVGAQFDLVDDPRTNAELADLIAENARLREALKDYQNNLADAGKTPAPH